MVLDIEPTSVARAGTDLQSLGAEAKAKVGSLFASGEAAANGHAGWQSSAQLLACGQAWRAQLEQMIDYITNVGLNLTSSAVQITAEDVEAADRIDDVLHGLAGR
ncbi:hypothetical protein ACTMTJ_41990 [Phytohabitans sp. LJ34]|uniref:hypothetical protein n=1 Tax=Phytohabitans sp. LJ34 TaxID=3452217 RepID=UPI003F8AE242